MLTFRPFNFSDSDYEFLAGLWNENYPNQPESADRLKFSDEIWEKKYLRERYFGVLDGRLVSSTVIAEPFWSLEPGKYFFGFTVKKDLHGQGLEDDIYQLVMDKLSRFELKKLITSAREDEPSKLKMFETHDFVFKMRYPMSFLDVQSFDPSPYLGLREKLELEGIKVLTAAELTESDPDFMRKWYDFEWEIAQDIPYPGELTRESFEQFVKFTGDPSFFPEAIFFAVDGGELAGTSGLWKNGVTDKLLNTGLTGVLRSHRRRGIATMLKVEGIKLARSLGVEKIDTDNEENNPMFQLNLQLGFKPAPAWMDFEKLFS